MKHSARPRHAVWQKIGSVAGKWALKVRAKGLGCRALGVGFKCLGFRDLGCGVLGLGCRVQGSVSRDA